MHPHVNPSLSGGNSGNTLCSTKTHFRAVTYNVTVQCIVNVQCHCSELAYVLPVITVETICMTASAAINSHICLL